MMYLIIKCDGTVSKSETLTPEMEKEASLNLIELVRIQPSGGLTGCPKIKISDGGFVDGGYRYYWNDVKDRE